MDNQRNHQGESNSGAEASRIESLPAEIHKSILSNLPFGDHIRFANASSTAKAYVCACPTFGHVLSNDGGRLILSKVLRSYQDYIDPTAVCEVGLTTNIPTSDNEYSAIRAELEQVIHWLDSQNCRSIKKAKIHIYCFSRRWLGSFANIASASLTDLSLLTFVNQIEINQVLQHILSNFLNLTSLYFGTKPRTASHCNASFDKCVLESCRGDIMDSLSTVAPLRQHTNLTSLHIESDEQFDFGWLENGIFLHLPNLETFTMTGEIRCQLANRAEHFYMNLLRSCPSLKSFNYHHRIFEEYKRAFTPSTNKKNLPPVLTSTFTQQTGNLTRKFHFTSRYEENTFIDSGYRGRFYRLTENFNAILNICNATLTEMDLVLYEDFILDIPIGFMSFPLLERLVLDLRSLQSPRAMPENPYYSIGFHSCHISSTNSWIRLFQSMPHLRYLKLVGPLPQDSCDESIRISLPNLKTVVLEWTDYSRNILHIRTIDAFTGTVDQQNISLS